MLWQQCKFLTIKSKYTNTVLFIYTMEKTNLHEIRKELKLLKLKNMKLKKNLRLAMRVRHLNRIRLEDEIVQLNILLSKTKYNILKYVNKNLKDISENEFRNPETIQYNDNANKCSDKDGNIKADLFLMKPIKTVSSDYKFFCDKCEFKCKKKTPFDIHMRRHEGIKPFVCDICQKGFVAKYELKLHKGKHSGIKSYNCDECTYTTYRPDMLINHKVSHTNNKSNCNLCEQNSQNICTHKVFENEIICIACVKAKENYIKNFKKRSEKNLNTDAEKINIEHSCGKIWICDTCSLSFTKREALIKHIRTHTGERPYKCDRCDYAAAIHHTLIIHKRKHSGEKPFVCDQCSFRCTTKGYLKIHLNKHKGIKPFACDQCDYRSVDSCKLSIHRKINHSNEKPFACELCSFRTKLCTRLRQHLRVHGPRPYVCPHCAKSFTLKRTLQEHEGIHTGNQPFQCKICKVEKRFTLEVFYKRHLARHELKFNCNICNYRTSLQKDLKRHLKVHFKTPYTKKLSDNFYHCNICKFRSEQMAYLMKHIEEKHPEQKYPQKSAVQLTSLKNIVNEQLTNTSFDSSILNITNSHRLNYKLNEPVQRMDSVTNYTNLSSSAISLGDVVQDNRTPQHNLYICNICNINFSNIEELFSHRRIAHPKITDYNA